MRLALSLALATALGLALTSNAAASPGDQLTGGGISGFGAGTHFGFTAHDGPNGPSGHATFKNKPLTPPDADRRGQVVCINVSGNRAVFGVADPNEAGGGVSLRQFYVEDNGNPNKNPKDELTEVVYDNCASAADRPFAIPIRSGNIEVRDR